MSKIFFGTCCKPVQSTNKVCLPAKALYATWEEDFRFICFALFLFHALITADLIMLRTVVTNLGYMGHRGTFVYLMGYIYCTAAKN